MQTITSSATSINTKRLPAVYNKINWFKYKDKNLVLFDYGCGKKETRDLISNMLSDYGIEYIPYDKYNMSEEEIKKNLSRIEDADIIVCSNVLNVINDGNIICDILKKFHELSRYSDIFIMVYEGDRTGRGKETSKGYQTNLKKEMYQTVLNCYSRFNKWDIKKGVITNRKINIE